MNKTKGCLIANFATVPGGVRYCTVCRPPASAGMPPDRRGPPPVLFIPPCYLFDAEMMASEG
ncbi:hypothetical protein DBP80_25280 [Salmonella enterica subsp. enterica serovar 4,[5],12:i:-]|uniref:Uncharacterized protein n=1 Tax=Salmonella enterica subsp. enterica serovar 4,12:i:- TaxID=353569 RepID=A0A9X7PTX9_SALET|nr:hypothetical protein [Salmonella enterica]MYO42366.1 hypothetical protein [Salmonella enterica subsp. enterica serovar 4,12:i:-]PUH37245.1 hypothetical protein DBP48_22310 [Salmonella enterica subsp. enterica serovar 4,[5],12:i:-]ECK0179142.1 hypothetical protein [Salmonella enterica]ECK0183825.1 hypothetical protein [Salmonella enterica]